MTPGTTISHYRIVDQLGRGGMGIVYKAEDTKLDRTVALKLLPPHALISEDDRARFYREARAAAALNHPNIAHVYEIDEADVEGGESRPFIAMEYIDGQTLGDLIAKGPLPLKDAISYASQIAEGLKVAHEANVVHRDIKSGNIMLTSKGVVKILDFGLAKTTASTKLTQMGSTLGTVAYMSPEQAKGEEVDRRTDIWSTGVILYEMITGRLPFAGDYEQAIVYGILNEDPESMTALRAGVPMALDGIMAKLLAKDPGLRYQHIDELPADLKAIDLGTVVTRSRISTGSASSVAAGTITGLSTAAPHAHSQTYSDSTPWYRHPVTLLVVTAAMFLGAAVGFLLRGEPTPTDTLVRRVAVPLETIQNTEWPAISPAGDYVAVSGSDTTTGEQGVFLYHMPTGVITRIPGSPSGETTYFSDDGRWLMYGSGAGAYKVLVPNGDPIQIVGGRVFPSWESASSILFSRDGKVWRATADGRDEAIALEADSTLGHRALWVPVAIPGTHLALSTAVGGGDPDAILVDLAKSTYSVLAEGAVYPRFVPPGYIVYTRGWVGQVVVQAFDTDRRQTTGQAVPVPIGERGFWTYGVGPDGSLIYGDWTGGTAMQLSWLNEAGDATIDLPIEVGWFDDPMISPDGKSLAVARENQSADQEDIYVYDLDTGTPLRLTFAGERGQPAWSADGRYVYYEGWQNGSSVFRKKADGTGTEEVIVSSGARRPSLSSDGRLMAYDIEGVGGRDIWVLDFADSTSRLIVGGDGGQWDAQFSPDGKYVVYVTNASGQTQIYVHQVTGDAFWEISEGPGPFRNPVWSTDGKHIYYESSRDLLRVPVELQPSLRRLGRPESISSWALGGDFAIDPTGKVLVMRREGESGAPTVSRLRMVINWPQELNRMVPRSEG